MNLGRLFIYGVVWGLIGLAIGNWYRGNLVTESPADPTPCWTTNAHLAEVYRLRYERWDALRIALEMDGRDPDDDPPAPKLWPEPELVEIDCAADGRWSWSARLEALASSE